VSKPQIGSTLPPPGQAGKVRGRAGTFAAAGFGPQTMHDDSDIDRAGRAKRGSPFLTTDQAAAYLKISAKSLKRLRRDGKGPAFRRHTRMIQYHIDDLDSWSRESGARDSRS
jgi:hypothetical protein